MQAVNRQEKDQKAQQDYQNTSVALMVFVDTLAELHQMCCEFHEERHTSYLGKENIEIGIKYVGVPPSRFCEDVLGIPFNAQEPEEFVIAEGIGKGKDEMLAEIAARKDLFQNLIRSGFIGKIKTLKKEQEAALIEAARIAAALKDKEIAETLGASNEGTI
jgi:hypothetical protein